MDLDRKTRQRIEEVLRRFLPDTEVRLVGSRARPGAKRQADVDLLVMRAKPLLPAERASLNTAFEESDIPFKVDVLEWGCLTPAFRSRLLAPGAPVLLGARKGREGREPVRALRRERGGGTDSHLSLRERSAGPMAAGCGGRFSGS